MIKKKSIPEKKKSDTEAAEIRPGLPGDAKDPDTRTGSLEINTNGGFGGEFQDPACAFA